MEINKIEIFLYYKNNVKYKMDICNELIKTGPRKGNICGAAKKVIDIIDGKEIPHCNRHRIKNKQKDDAIDILSNKLDTTLKIEDDREKLNNKNNIEVDNNIHKKDINEVINYDEQNILNKLDKQLDELFNKYGL